MGGDAKLIGKHAEVAKTMLRKITDLFDKLEIEYILDFGTLLGVVRENRLLPWDTDLDISITHKDLEKLIKNKRKLWRLGYRTRVRYFDKDTGPFKKGEVRIIKVQTRKFVVVRDKGILDIFVMKNIDGEYSYVVKKEGASVLKTIPTEFHDNKTRIEFDNKQYSVPKDYERYLEYVYGDWRTPVKEWDYFLGDNTVKKVYGKDE